MIAFRRLVATVGLVVGPLVAVAPAWAQASNDMAVWLRRNCLDKGTGDHPLIGKEFEACLRKRIENLPALDKSKRELFGEKYDPARYVDCRLRPNGRADAACDVYILRRREWPEYWPGNSKRIRWPEPPKESVYRPGMKPKEYWEALCKAEAGEFVHRAAKNIEGFLLIRPRGAETDQAMQDPYVIEDAYGLREFYSSVRERRPGVFFLDRSDKAHRYIEARIFATSGEPKYVRHEADLRKLSDLLKNKANDKWGEEDFSRIVEVKEFSSRYGLTWRGIRRERDFELGISGGELAIVDLTTGETLALRRGFALDPLVARGIREQRSWLSSAGCPVMARDFLTLTAFVRRVLVPKGI